MNPLVTCQLCLLALHQWYSLILTQCYTGSCAAHRHTDSFITAQVHEATRKLSFVPSSPEEFADLLAFLEKLESSRHSMDEACDHVRTAVRH